MASKREPLSLHFPTEVFSVRHIMRRDTKVQAQVRRQSSTRKTNPSPPVRLVLVEEGADPIDVHTVTGDGDETLVLGQGRGECATDFTYRVIQKLSALEQVGRRVGVAVLRVAPRVDPQTMAARNLLARALLTHSAVAGPTELVFGAGARIGKGLRLRLLALVEELIQESVTGSTTLRIQFDEPGRSEPPHSGVMAVAPVADPKPRDVRSAGSVRGADGAPGSLRKGA